MSLKAFVEEHADKEPDDLVDLFLQTEECQQHIRPSLRNEVINLLRMLAHDREKNVFASISAKRALAEPISRDDLTLLLHTPFSLGDNERILWMRATVDEHRQRIAFLQKQVDALQETISFHQEAIKMIEEAGVGCLEELPESVVVTI